LQVQCLSESYQFTGVGMLGKLTVLFLFTFSVGQAQVNINIYPNSTISNINSSPFGVVLNQMTDGVTSLGSLSQAVQQTGSKRLRFPEGESADNYFFTDPSTLANPNPATHRVGNTRWWPANSNLADSKGRFYKGLNFDQFMSVATSTGAIPNVVLCYPCGNKSLALDMAKAWVKYAKDKGYNVGQWEIGNETYYYFPNYTDNYQVGVTEYARDVIQWSRALKAIDPRIKIGANGDKAPWFNSLLTYRHPTLNIYAAQTIDFLVVHSYQLYHSSFSSYQANQNAWGTLDFYSAVRDAEVAINQSNSIVNTSHLRIAMTETSSMNYTSNDPNNLGAAIVTVEMLLEILKSPRLDYAELWASRWVKNFSATPQASDTFSSSNKLNASGVALSLVNKFVGNRKIGTTGATSNLRVFSSIDNRTNTVNTFIVNRSSSAQTVKLNIYGVTSTFVGTLYKLTGSSPSDFNPIISAGTAVYSTTPSLTLKIEPTSVYVVVRKAN